MGKGTLYWKNGEKYVGEFKDGLFGGFGMLTFEKDNEVDYYQGQWDNDERSGHGTLAWKNGVKYEGEWKEEIKNGFGKIT